jgi:hypothetical protein
MFCGSGLIQSSWTDSQLKAFADKHNIPVPQPRQRDEYLKAVRSNYESAAKKAKEQTSYPGNWIYQAWSESDLKEWLDYHGVPVPQPTTRDKLIASVRRNSRLATLRAQAAQKSASASAKSAGAEGTASAKSAGAEGTASAKSAASVASASAKSAASEASASAKSAAASASGTAKDTTDSVLDSILAAWDDSQIKAWADKNGIKVPHGSKRAELEAIARKHKAQLTGDTAAQSAASAYGAATTKAGNQWAKATDDAQLKAQHAFDLAIGQWSESRLKAYLDARGVPVPQGSKKDELVATVRKHSHKAATGYSAWTYDDWTYDNLKNWLLASGDKNAKIAAEKADATREDLVNAAQDYYAQASAASGNAFASVTSYLSQATEHAKANAFDTWTDSDLKAYLDSYGAPVPQGSTKEELKAYARKQSTYFRYGTSTPQGTLWAKVKENAAWAYDQLVKGAQQGKLNAEQAATKGKHRAEEAGNYAKDRAYEEKEKAKHRAQEEL